MQTLRRQLTSSIVRRTFLDGNLRSFLASGEGQGQPPIRKNFFSSNAALRKDDVASKSESSKESNTVQKRKPLRSAGKTSLRRVAVEAQRSRENVNQKQVTTDDGEGSNRVTAISVADQYDMEAVVGILRSHGFSIDPDGTGFETDQVIHTRGAHNGDIFVFPSGSVVAWSLPEDVVSDLATKILFPAAIHPHPKHRMEMEDLEYHEDAKRDTSSMRGDVIILGAKLSQLEGEPSSRVDTTLSKIAFSSGLARSTKLAVLESSLQKYIDSMKAIPTVLAKGSRLPISRRWMLKKTGELLELRAQLNHYSELTDSLPDLFWDMSHELGLEGYYDQVGKALDVSIRIKTLNEKMDYAQEIASILRQTLSEKHMVDLEWVIILLIAVEVVFAIRKEWKEWRARVAAREEAAIEA